MPRRFPPPWSVRSARGAVVLPAFRRRSLSARAAQAHSDRFDENASSNDNRVAVKPICESIRTWVRRNFARRKSGI